MGEGKHHEIERKLLIAMPDIDFLRVQPDCAIWEIEQIYLDAEPGCTRRIRRVSENGEERYYRTFKQRLTALSCIEDEGSITFGQFVAYRREAATGLTPILKTRYRIPYREQLLEFDIYPFWQDRAVLEIELESEAQAIELPDWVQVLKDVTADRRYKNVCLAAEIPYDTI